MKGWITLGLLLFLGGFYLSQPQKTSSETLIIYSARQEQLLNPLIEAFTQETGIPIKVLSAKAGPLVERIQNEGQNCPADILITVDAGNLWHAQEKGLFQATHSPILDKNIPKQYKDSNNHWFGFSLRARSMVYNTQTVDPNTLSTYENLAQDKWAGKLLLRTAKKVYNQSLIAMMIDRLGAEKTKKIIEGWVQNLATPVYSSDTEVLKALDKGIGQVGIVNTYYLGRFLKNNPDAPLALFWANQNSSGTHVNISGAGILKHAKNPKIAQRFLEWLSTEKAQTLFANTNLEYPVNPTIKNTEAYTLWGPFKADNRPLSQAGVRQQEATLLMKAAAYH